MLPRPARLNDARRGRAGRGALRLGEDVQCGWVTRGSELIAQGQHKDVVQRVLGHRDPRSTDGYAELHDGQVRAALEEGR